MPFSSKREFDSFYKSCKKIHTNYFVIFYKLDKKKRFSVIASKKIGKAVKRNFAKRRLRALFIEACDDFFGSMILVAKKDLIEANFLDIKKSFKKALKKLHENSK